MKHIEINIGKSCNNKCRFCISALDGYSNTKDWTIIKEEFVLVDFSKVKEEIILYSKKGYDSIGFLGGDISIHPKIYDILNEAKINGFKNINIITNAMIFDDIKKATLLISSGTTRVNISIHSHIDKIEDHLTQIRGGLSRKLKAIDNFNVLYNKGLLKSPISLNIVLNRLNYHGLVETCLFFHKIKGINDIRINFLWNRFFTSEKDKKDLEIKYSDILGTLKQLIYISFKYNIRITFDTIPPCIFYEIDKVNYKVIIKKFLGEQYDYIDEISNISINQTFNRKVEKKDELKIKPKSCKKCAYINICEGVWKEYIEEYGNKEFNIIK